MVANAAVGPAICTRRDAGRDGKCNGQRQSDYRYDYSGYDIFDELRTRIVLQNRKQLRLKFLHEYPSYDRFNQTPEL